MKRILFVVALVSMLALAATSFAFEKGEEVDLCDVNGEYTLLAPEAECAGEVVKGTVSDVLETEIVVQVGEGQTVTFPIQ